MGPFNRVIAALCVSAPIICAGAAPPSIPLSEYKTRRQALRNAIGDGVTILFGAVESEGGELRNGFFQDEDFYYLTGWREPGAILVITARTEALLIPRRDPVQERWTGPKSAPGDKNITEVTGFETVLPSESFEAKLPEWLEQARAVYTLPRNTDELKRAAPLREIRSADMTIARLRMVKSAAEIAAIQFSTDVTMDAHRAAWEAIGAGKPEYEIASVMTSVYFRSGCERNAYSPIVGSGPNAAILHYSKNRRRLDGGELVLMDVGAECAMYATDITRTVPVNGKFTDRQRELYNVVLGAQKAALAAVKPGVMLGSRRNVAGLQKIAYDYIDSHGKDLHGDSLGKYFIHGIGHHVGLDVHDAYDPSLPLDAGMIITLEPGIYIPEENIGIRIEDMVLVTKEGGKLLSRGLPREPAEIENFMSASAKQSK